MDDAGDIAVADQPHGGASGADLLDQLGVTRTVEDAGGDLGDRHALGLGERVQIVGGRSIEIDEILGVARSDGDLVHIERRHLEQAAALGDGDDGERIGKRLGGERRAFDGIDGDIDLKPRARAGADRLADIEKRRFALLALADDDDAVERKRASSRYMAVMAAESAAASSPRPRSRAAAIAVASVTRTISRPRVRSSLWLS